MGIDADVGVVGVDVGSRPLLLPESVDDGVLDFERGELGVVDAGAFASFIRRLTLRIAWGLITATVLAFHGGEDGEGFLGVEVVFPADATDLGIEHGLVDGGELAEEAGDAGDGAGVEIGLVEGGEVAVEPDASPDEGEVVGSAFAEFLGGDIFGAGGGDGEIAVARLDLVVNPPRG